jgi:UDP-2,4-diacetamido-2,4,6-trideoxy-beta-L-altropyranose hydrolase
MPVVRVDNNRDAYRLRAQAEDIHELAARPNKKAQTEFVNWQILDAIQLVPDDILVDIGCGDASLLRMAKGLVSKSVGIASSVEEQKRLAAEFPGLRFISNAARSLALESGSVSPAERALLIRADASSEIGLGHVMRCAALGQEWRRAGGRVIFALASGAKELEERLRSWGSEVAMISADPGSENDAAQTKELCQRYQARWLVLDGYDFWQDYRTMVRNGKARLLLMDDLGDCAPYNCDIVVNDNPHASLLYNESGVETRFLLGPRHALLRREFMQFQRELAEVPGTAKRILVTCGGGDAENVTLTVMHALQQVRNSPLEITVVAGANNPHRRSLQEAVGASVHSARMLVNVNNMPELMSHSDLAISAGGVTCYELAFMRVPMVLIIAAKNQERTVTAFSDAGAAVSAGWFDRIETEALARSLLELIGDQKRREKLREGASQMVDGRGAERVVEAMLQMERNEVQK